jgi:hypothetical protein
MRRLLRELRRKFPGTEIRTTHGNHYEIRWPDGRFVIASNTPGNEGAMLRKVVADARRQSRKDSNRKQDEGTAS